MEPATPEPRFAIAHLREGWYVACRSAELGKRPLARTLLDVPLVLFRGGDPGRPVALLDRCAHRNLPLSVGRMVGSRIECAYHGWQYDERGQCRLVPALADEPDRRGRAVPVYPAVEQQGYVWVYGSAEREPHRPPFSFPFLGAPGYASIRFETTVEASVHATIENMLDVPHTAFLHRGLFRNGRQNRIAAIVRRFADRAEAEYVGEPRPSGLIGRLLAPEGGTVVHFDRFLLPSIAQVEYRLGERSHLLITSALTPVTDFVTRFVSVVSFRLPLPTLLVRLVLTPIAKRIFRQDAWILRLQTDSVRRFGGERYISTEVDLLGPHVWRLMKDAATDGEPGEDRAAPAFEKRVELAV
ncbi:MAG: Rieske 2Fe-2S domain-containing protein [Candidatus Binatia bacterium]